MDYTFTENPPHCLSDDEYALLAMREFQNLLTNSPSQEPIFQDFFEKNPSFLPGARGELYDMLWGSGHGPYLQTLITQPQLQGLGTRSPDFLWLAYDSMCLNPVLIEIEAPSKKYFNQDRSLTSAFTKAKQQLDEWKAILSKPENVLKFLSDFDLPKDLRNLQFEPFYVLIYGRREEYANDTWLSQKRANIVSRTDRQVLMSYDRLVPRIANRNFVCCEVKYGRYIAKCLSPTFKLNIYDDRLLKIENLVNAVDEMAFTSDARKEFLKQKIPHLLRSFQASKKNTMGFTIKDFGVQFQE